MGMFLVGAERLRADHEVQVGALLASAQLHIPALHVLHAIHRQQRPSLGAPLGAHVGPRIGQVDPAGLPGADLRVQVPAGQPDRSWRVLLQGADGHDPIADVQSDNRGGGAVHDA
jgi:hypothetical protein